MSTTVTLSRVPRLRISSECVGRRHAVRLALIERARANISAKAALDGATDAELLAFVVAGRDARRGEAWDIAKNAWRLLAARHHDRVRGLVVTFRFPGHPDVQIAPDNYDDAAQECFIRIAKMLGNFRGVSLGEFLGALRTCVSNTCMDHCRRRLTRERGIAGSIDEPAPGSEDASYGRFDAALGEVAERSQAQQAEARDDLAVLEGAISQLDNEQMREVLRRKMHGYSSAEIAAELGLSVANVDQLCSRGVRKLRQVMSDD
jgi:RNA polymerase sigma factor (sigma-70 family)